VKRYKKEWTNFVGGKSSGRPSVLTYVQVKRQISEHIRYNQKIIIDEMAPVMARSAKYFNPLGSWNLWIIGSNVLKSKAIT
jgi:hypothetical protein